MPAAVDINQLSEPQLREYVAQMQRQLADQEGRIAEQDAIIARCEDTIRRYQIREEHLSHEMALLKRYHFGKRAEGVNRAQFSLLEDLVDEDLASIDSEIEHLRNAQHGPAKTPKTSKRRPLPPQL